MFSVIILLIAIYLEVTLSIYRYFRLWYYLLLHYIVVTHNQHITAGTVCTNADRIGCFR